MNGGENETFDQFEIYNNSPKRKNGQSGRILACGYVYKFHIHTRTSLFGPENKTRIKSNNINISRFPSALKNQSCVKTFTF